MTSLFDIYLKKLAVIAVTARGLFSRILDKYPQIKTMTLMRGYQTR